MNPFEDAERPRRPAWPGSGLHVTTEPAHDHVELRAEGEIDMATVHHLEEHIEQAVETAAQGCRVVLDLSGCTFIDSAGLHVLTETCIEGNLEPPCILGATSVPVERVLEAAGLANLFHREP